MDSLSIGNFVICFIIGMIVGSVIVSYLSYADLDRILQYQTDCKVKEFYYMDSHRTLCDKIGVIP